MNKALSLLVLASLAVVACADNRSPTSTKLVRWFLGEAEQKPTLEDMSPDQVIIMGNHAEAPAVQAEAARGCHSYDRAPVLKSQTCVDNLCWQKRYVYACRAI